MFYMLFIIALLINFSNTIDETDKVPLKIHRKKSFTATVFSANNPLNATCQWLSRLKFQNKLCWQKRGLPQALRKAKYLAVKYCEDTFRYDQWNCSRKDKYFKKIYRETALMYSMTSSALMYALARACAEGTLAACKCGEYGKPENNSTDWQWRGCADNTKFARKFTRRFLQLRKKGDHLHTILKHNSEVGIRLIMENNVQDCRCHGISGNTSITNKQQFDIPDFPGSCSVKICFKRIRPFEKIAEKLKKLYHNAIQIESNHLRNPHKGKQKRKLLYMENSPNYCSETMKRQCKNTENCATLCCGRGFDEETIELVEQCNCSWRDRSHYAVDCKNCTKYDKILICR